MPVYLGGGVYQFDATGQRCLFHARTLERYTGLGPEEVPVWSEASVLTPSPERNHLQIAVTTQCNFDCIYCQLKRNDNPCLVPFMGLDTAQDLVEKYPHIFRRGTIMLTGGEPLLNWPVCRFLLEQTQGRGMIFTNAALLTEEQAEYFAKRHIFVIVSLDGRRDVNHFSRRYANGACAYPDIERGIRCLQNAGCPFGISMVIQEENIQHLAEECRQLYEQYRPVSMGVNLPHYTKYFHYEVPEELLIREFSALYRLSVEEGLFIDQIARLLSPLVSQTPKYNDCSACGKKVVVYPDGVESNCIVKYLFTHGNDLDIWKGCSPLHEEMCRDCIAVGCCGGGCRFDAEMRGEPMFDTRRCGVTRAIVEQAVSDLFAESVVNYETVTRNPAFNVWSVGHDF